MPRVVILPGVMGSAIELDRGWFNTDYWCEPSRLAVEGPAPLLVNAAGDGDGFRSLFKSTVITGPLRSYYGRLIDFMTGQGWSVLPLGYDWRLGLQQNAGPALAAVQSWARSEPVYLLAHSLGGLLGRAILRLAASQGASGQVVRLVTMGSPHQGSLSICRLFGRLDPSYRLLIPLFFPHLAAMNALAGGSDFLDRLDAIIGSFVSPYEMLPQPGSPVFPDAGQYGYVCSRAAYIRFNGWTRDERFAAAQVTHGWLGQAVYPDKQVSLVGTGITTAYRIADVHNLGEPAGYGYGEVGDGVVDEYSAQLPGVPQVRFNGVAHAAWPYSERVLPQIPQLLLNGAQ